ncbi:MAG: VPLPA-CTERM sorting domain-containing protein, partial [Gammaproteobacteria bacterium]
TANASLLNLLNTHLIGDFSFQGSITMYQPNGQPLVLPPSETINSQHTEQGVTGSMALDFVTFGGTASMHGDAPFFGANWTANGNMSAHVDPLLGNECQGHLMCADANMNFVWNGNNIPVQASFALDPNSPFSMSAPYVGASFTVSSLDRDLDGIPGTKMTSGPFTGITPSFKGQAVLTGLQLGNAIPNPGYNYAPNTSSLTLTSAALSTVPLPGAAWLFGSGLVGLVGIGRRSKSKVPS